MIAYLCENIDWSWDEEDAEQFGPKPDLPTTVTLLFDNDFVKEMKEGGEYEVMHADTLSDLFSVCVNSLDVKELGEGHVAP